MLEYIQQAWKPGMVVRLQLVDSHLMPNPSHCALFLTADVIGIVVAYVELGIVHTLTTEEQLLRLPKQFFPWGMVKTIYF